MKNNDTKLFKWMGILIALPLGLAIFGGDRFRYPCQDPANWGSAECKAPVCSVTKTCPEDIFKESTISDLRKAYNESEREQK